mmetsp:Transcript_37853/g.81714  ORF Transcript_37853/g.81714 Transcript_37853/m.81714 type:complete len:416 (+) Transcript_37853:188-1435(+)
MADSDDSSAESSGDEMLNMICPFSQSQSPLRSTGKGSDSDGVANIGGEQGAAPDTTNYLGEKRKHEAVVIKSSTEATEKMEEKARENAKKAFNMAFHGSKIGVPDKLCWHERTKKRKKIIVPVRVVPKEEVIGLALRAWNEETHHPVQYIQYPHPVIKSGVGEYATASKRSLSPYYSKDSRIDQWCSIKFEQYSKQLKRSHKGLEAVDLKTEQSFLRCVLEKSMEEGEQEKKLSQVDEAVPEKISTSVKDGKVVGIDSEEDDNEEDARGSKRSCRRSIDKQEQRTERLRPGDRIEYYAKQFVAGDPGGLREATILSIDPKGDPILTVDAAFTCLEPDHQVKLLQRCRRGKLVDNDGGKYRPINQYTLHKEGDPDALRKLVMGNAAKGKKIIQKAKENAIAEMEKDGTSAFKDMIR